MANYNEICESFEFPLVPLECSIFAFPGISITVDISNPLLKNAVEAAKTKDSFVYLVTQINPMTEKFDVNNIYSVGTVAKIKQVTRRGGKTVLASFESVCRAEHQSITEDKGYFSCKAVAKKLEVTDFDPDEAEALLRTLKEKAASAISMFSAPSKELLAEVQAIDDIDFLSDLAGALILTRPADK